LAKLTEAQIKAQKRYDDKNRERRTYVKQRSTAKTFIRKADLEDLLELKEMIESKINETS
jgi:ribosomal protein S20